MAYKTGFVHPFWAVATDTASSLVHKASPSICLPSNYSNINSPFLCNI